MTTPEHNPFPPSSSRLAFAAQRGLLIRSPLFLLGCILIGASSIGLFLIPYATESFISLFHRSLVSNDLQTQLRHVTQILFVAVAIAGLPVFAAVALTFQMIRRQKKTGRTSAPLPASIPTFADNLLLGTLALFLLIPVGIAITRAGGFSFYEILISPHVAVIRLGNTLLRIALAGGAIAVLLGVLQLSLYKMRLFKHLSLTTAQQKNEQRLHGPGNIRERIQSSTRPH